MISFCVKPENIHTKYVAFCVCLVFFLVYIYILTREGIHTAYIGFYGMPWRRQQLPYTTHSRFPKVLMKCAYFHNNNNFPFHIVSAILRIVYVYLEHPPYSHSQLPCSVCVCTHIYVYGRWIDIRTPFFTQIITLW